VLLGESANHAILDEIVGGGGIAGKSARIAAKAWDFSFEFAIEICHWIPR
jgi:hypothetical protein